MFKRVNEMGRGRAHSGSKTWMKRASATVREALCEMNHNEVGQVDANVARAHQMLDGGYLGVWPVRMMVATPATG